MLSLPSIRTELSRKDISDIWSELKADDKSERIGNCGHWTMKLSKKLQDEGIYTRVFRVALGLDRTDYHMVAAHEVKSRPMVLDPTLYAYIQKPIGIFYGTTKDAIGLLQQKNTGANPEHIQKLQLCYSLLEQSGSEDILELRLPGLPYTQIVDIKNDHHIM